MAQEFSLKLKLDVDTQQAIQKINILLQNLKQSMGKLGSEVKILDTKDIDKEFSKVTTQLNMAATSSEKAKNQLGQLSTQLDATAKSGSTLGKAFQFNQIAQSIQILSQTLNQFTQPYIQFEGALADLSAITGVSGKALDQFGESARKLALSFGGTATGQIESFKGILSRLGPDIAKSPEALEKMAVAINTLSKASGLDAAQSMDALTNSMLQFNVDLSDPLKAADEMTKMMNVMAAGAKEGAAEVPQVGEAIVQAGIAAKGAGLSFEETNAAIQVLATGGKYGAEAGVALRNSLALLQKQSGPGNAALKGMGLSIEDLGKTLNEQGLAPTLQKLSDGLNTIGSDAERNATLFQLFGQENASAMGILLGRTDSLRDFTSKMTDTNTAFEQSTIIMDTMQSKLERVKANIEDKLITVFKSLGSEVTIAIGAVSQLAPVLTAMTAVKTILPEGAINSIKDLPNLFNKALPMLTSFSSKLTSIAPGLAGVGTAGASAFSTIGTAGVASGTATTTAWATALAPILAVIAVIGLLVVGFLYLYNNVESFKKVMDDFIGVLLYGLERGWEALQKIFEVLLSLGGAVFEFVITPFKVLFDILGSVASAFGVAGNGLDIMGIAMQGVGIIFDTINKVLFIAKASLDGFTNGLQSITSSFGGIITNVLKGDVIGATKLLFEAGPNAANSFKDGFTKSFTSSAIEENATRLKEKLEEAGKIKIQISKIDNLDKITKDYENIMNDISKIEVKPKTEMSQEEINNLEFLKKKAQETAIEIGKLAPEAKKNMKTIVDESGNIKEVYDINIDKAKEFGSAQKNIFSNELNKKQSEYSSQLLESSKLYDEQKLKLGEMAKKATELKLAGKNDEYKKQVKDIGEFGAKLDENKQKLIDGFQGGIKGGLLTKDALDKVGKQMGLNNESIQQASRLQQDMKYEVELTSAAVADMGTAFKEAMNKAKEAQTNAVGGIAELRRQLKAGSIDQKNYDDLRKQLIEDGKKATTEYNQLTEFEKQAKADLGLIEEKNASSKKLNKENELDLSKKIFDQERKNIQQSYEQFEINAEQLRLEQDREKNNIDDILLSEEKLKSLETEKAKLIEIYKIQTDTNGNVLDIRVKLTKDQKKDKIVDDLNNELISIQQNIEKETNKNVGFKLKVKLDAESLQDELDKQKIDNIKYNIQIGVQSSDDLILEYQSQYTKLSNVIEKEEDKLSKLKDKRTASKNAGDGANLVLDAEIKAVEDKLKELSTKEIAKRREIEGEKEKIRKETLDKIREQNSKEIALLEEKMRTESILNKIVLDTVSKSLTYDIDKKLSDSKNQLQKRLDDGIITQDEYNKKIESLENEHQKRLEVIQAAARGAELEAERQQTLNLLEEKRKRLEAELATLDPVLDADEYSKVSKQLDDVKIALEDKGDSIKYYTSELQTSIAETFANLFGDDEALKTSARKMFATLAGILQTYASAQITKMILAQLGLESEVTGIGALLLIPIIQGLANAAVGAIMSPVLSSLTSFSTGGRVDEPTLAIVGDASQSRGGADTEWILRDDQLQFILGIYLNKSSKEIYTAMKNAMTELGIDSVVRFYTDNMNLNVVKLNNNIEQLATNIHAITEKGVTYEELMRLSYIQVERKNIVSDLENGKMNVDDYISKSNAIEYSAISFANGSGTINTPTLSIIGDAGRNNPERVLNDPQLRAIIEETSSRSNVVIEKKLNEVISTLQKIDWNIYVDSGMLTDEVNRENNRRKFKY